LPFVSFEIWVNKVGHPCARYLLNARRQAPGY
jgi:hypothetical protein